MTEHPALTAEELLHDVRWLRRFARRLVRDPEDAEEVTQEAWVSVLEHAPRDIDRAGLRSWLARVARNLAAHRWRDVTLRRHHEERRAREAQRTSESTAASELEELQRQHELVGLVLGLEEPYRAALLLRYRRELAYPEMARALGIAESAARKRVSRGLALLRERIAGELGAGWREHFAVLAGAPAGPTPLELAPWAAAAAALLAGFVLLRAVRGGAEPETGTWSAAAPSAHEGSEPEPAEREALERIQQYLGCNGFAWDLPGRTLSQRHSFTEGAEARQSEALIGWDPGTSRLVFQAFHSPLADFESSSEGWIGFEAEGALLREYECFEPDGSRRSFRERLALAGPLRLNSSVEVLGDDGGWWLPAGVPPERVFCGVMGTHATGEEEVPSERRHTGEDERALLGIEAFLGTWIPPDGEVGAELALEWGIEKRSVHVRESRVLADGRPWRAHGLIGWHFGERALVFLEFVPGGMNRGRCGLDPDGSLWREFRAFTGAGPGSEHRQRFRLEGADAWRLERSVRDAGAAWRSLAELRGQRR